MKLSKVMVVDDDEGDQFLSDRIISRFDPSIEILQAYDGKEALEILDKTDKQPDLIFLDINMPVMDGHEFLEIYSQREYRSSVVVVLTSSSQKIDKEKSLAFDFVEDYCEKPLNAEVLKKLLSCGE